MVHGTTPGVVAALLAGDLGDLSREQLGEDVETHVDRRQQQPITHVGDEDLQLALYLPGEHLGQSSGLEVDDPEARHKTQVRSRAGPRM